MKYQHGYIEQQAPLGLRFLSACMRLLLLLSLFIGSYIVMLGYWAYRSIM